MAHLYIYNSDYMWSYPCHNGQFDLAALQELCPDVQINRKEDLRNLERVNSLVGIQSIYKPYTLWFENDGEALAFMLIKDKFVKDAKGYIGMRFIMEDPDWNVIFEEADLITELGEKRFGDQDAISNSDVSASKRRFKKFKTEMEGAFRSFSPDFRQMFDDFEARYFTEIEGYQKNLKDVAREETNAKNRLKTRFNRYCVTKVKKPRK